MNKLQKNELEKNKQLSTQIETDLSWSWSADGEIVTSDSVDLDINLLRFKKAIELGAHYVTMYYLSDDV